VTLGNAGAPDTTLAAVVVLFIADALVRALGRRHGR
jgi:hypothetical protein